MADWQTLSSKVVYENPWMLVHEDAVINPAGTETIYGYVESKNDSVYVVPLDDDNTTYIVRQHRYTVNEDTWECVAGRDNNEPVEVAAKRELLEETGISANTIQILGTVQIANGISNFMSTFCIARGLTKVTHELDKEDGILDVKKLPLAEVIEKILAREIQCSQSIAAFLMVDAYLKRRRNNGCCNY